MYAVQLKTENLPLLDFQQNIVLIYAPANGTTARKKKSV
jgi:hypothetical protein